MIFFAVLFSVGFYYIVRLGVLKGMTRLTIYIWKLLINKNVANVRMKKNLMNTNTVVSVVDISGNIITKTATRRTNKGN